MVKKDNSGTRMRFDFDAQKSKRLRANPKRGIGRYTERFARLGFIEAMRAALVRGDDDEALERARELTGLPCKTLLNQRELGPGHGLFAAPVDACHRESEHELLQFGARNR